jgi:translation initiation factor 1A
MDKKDIGKQNITPGEIEQRVPLPKRKNGEMMAVVEQRLGGGHLRILCEDGKARLGRIPGKIKKRKWIKTGSLVIIKPWDFQDDKADVVYRYTPTQVANLSRNKLIPENLLVYI